ncbi:hypothetical protein ACIPSJ_39680 [Streptomyces sp. NPDC090088]|uniref:hypothetical protein n=1 Tax=Streptomyces sp. NPDC090088 TaxID=3365944 RepID=UPI00381C6F59
MALGTISGTASWSGATTRGVSVLHLDATEYFVHMIGPMALTSLAIIAVAYRLDAYKLDIASEKAFEPIKSDWRMWFNAALTLLVMVLLIFEVAELLVNVRKIGDQQDLIKRQAANAVPVMVLVLAVGVFTGVTGVMTDAGMIGVVASAALSVVPDSMGGTIPIFTVGLALPPGFFMSNDAYWFGVVPVLAESAAHYGIEADEIASAGSNLGTPAGPPGPHEGRSRRLPEARPALGRPGLHRLRRVRRPHRRDQLRLTPSSGRRGPMSLSSVGPHSFAPSHRAGPLWTGWLSHVRHRRRATAVGPKHSAWTSRSVVRRALPNAVRAAGRLDAESVRHARCPRRGCSGVQLYGPPGPRLCRSRVLLVRSEGGASGVAVGLTRPWRWA